MIVLDGAAGLTTAMAEVLPEAKWQHCKVHLIRKILRNVRVEDRQAIGDELKEIWYTSSKKEALRRANTIYKKYNDKYPKAMIRLKYGIHDTLTFLDFPEYPFCNIIPQLYRGCYPCFPINNHVLHQRQNLVIQH